MMLSTPTEPFVGPVWRSGVQLGLGPTRPATTTFNSTPSFPRAWRPTNGTHLSFLGLFLFSNPRKPALRLSLACRSTTNARRLLAGVE